MKTGTPGRAAALALAGWLVPLLALIPVALGHEAAAGESALFAGLLWLGALGPLGCAIAGGRAAVEAVDADRRGDLYWSGLAVVLAATVLLFVWDGATPYVSLGGLALVGAAPLAVGWSLGFGLGLRWRRTF